MNNTAPRSEKILWRHLRDLPYFRGMLRAVEDSFYQGLDLPGPVLDLGSGDGHFASVAFDHPLDVGLDPWWPPIVESKEEHPDTYKILVCADGSRIPYPTAHFGSAVSTSVLEHIPHIQEVLDELGRVVRPGGTFAFCVPNQRFPEKLLGTEFFRKIGMKSASDWYGRFFNRIARHQHTDPVEVWTQRLDHSGFKVIKHWDYFPPYAAHRLEVGHVLGLPNLVAKKLTGEWVPLKSKLFLWLPYRIARRPFLEPYSEEGVCTFYITQRVA